MLKRSGGFQSYTITNKKELLIIQFLFFFCNWNVLGSVELHCSAKYYSPAPIRIQWTYTMIYWIRISIFWYGVLEYLSIFDNCMAMNFYVLNWTCFVIKRVFGHIQPIFRYPIAFFWKGCPLLRILRLQYVKLHRWSYRQPLVIRIVLFRLIVEIGNFWHLKFCFKCCSVT